MTFTHSDGSNAAHHFRQAGLAEADPDIAAAIIAELARQRDGIELIASENFVSRAVLAAQGTVLTNKYAEGYPGRRYYGGCEHVDAVEALALERAKRLFGAAHANVQPHSGSQANQAVMLALLEPGDTILGLDLRCGGHLTHGAAVNLSGRWFRVASYGVRHDDDRIDYDELAETARRHRPRLIIAGGSAYPRTMDFARFRAIADEVGAWLLVDMAHVAGLVAAGLYPDPLPHAHAVTTTTHKTLRGPRGGMILASDAELGRRIDKAVFPGLQGGPLMHVVAAKAVALGEALQPAFRAYIEAVLDNARVLAETLVDGGVRLVANGTDTHLVLADLRRKTLTGAEAVEGLERVGITANKNSIPYDPQKPTVTSGIRLGSPAATTRGFGPSEFRQVGWIITTVLDALSQGRLESVIPWARDKVRDLSRAFPLYAGL